VGLFDGSWEERERERGKIGKLILLNDIKFLSGRPVRGIEMKDV
jgi:hypothetical protein